MTDKVKELFDGKPDYDARRDKYYFERRARELEKALANLNKNVRILDIGCGTGITIEFLRSKGFLRVSGGDISKTLLAVSARKNMAKLCLTANVQLPFASNAFNLVTMFDVIEHMDNYEENLMEVCRVLKPSGIVFISYPNPGMIWLIDIMAAIGLKIPGKENKIPFPELEAAARPFFEVESFRPIVLVSKLPGFALRFFEAIENLMPRRLLRRVALSYVVVLKKRL